MFASTTLARTVARALLAPAERRRLSHLSYRDGGHGYDRLGLHPAYVGAAIGATRFVHERYFRVTSHGSEHVPARGAAILAPNHSGLLPIDAVALYGDVVRHTNPPRVPRIVADFFVPQLPFASTFFSRVGVTSGARSTVRRLLEDGELMVIFPEGAPGIAKPFSERYRLRPWRMGHAELGLRHRAPIVPVGIVGPEEQWPLLARLDFLHPFGAPFLPIPATPLPLPVRTHIWYGEPILLHERFDPADADDPAVCAEAAALVRDAVQALLDRGVAAREGIFR